MEPLNVKLGGWNLFFTTKIIFIVKNTPIYAATRPLGAACGALDRPGDCAAAPTRPTPGPRAIVAVRRGKTTSNIVRSCDTVRAGAFFSQAQLQVPQKKMRQHTYQYMVVPARIFPHFLVVHAQRRFGFFKALCNGPPDPTEPDKGTPGRARRSITDRVRVHWGGPHRPLDHEPDGALRQALLTPCHALAGKRRLDGPLRPF
jgi:hypothetical protein